MTCLGLSLVGCGYDDGKGGVQFSLTCWASQATAVPGLRFSKLW